MADLGHVRSPIAFQLCFVAAPQDETIRFQGNHFQLACSGSETSGVYQSTQQGSRAAVTESETYSMRTMSLILACAFLFGGASVAGSSEGSVPGVGTFTYLGAVFPDGPGAQDASSLTCAAN